MRVNGADTAWFADDLAWCRAQSVRQIVLPKADATALAALHAELPDAHCHALLETAAGFADLYAVARAPGVTRLVFGSIDPMFDLDVADDGEPLHHFRSELVLHSRAAGLPAPVDEVCTAIGDAEALAADTARGRRFGFGAKLLIHPNQVEGVHAGAGAVRPGSGVGAARGGAGRRRPGRGHRGGRQDGGPPCARARIENRRRGACLIRHLRHLRLNRTCANRCVPDPHVGRIWVGMPTR